MRLDGGRRTMRSIIISKRFGKTSTPTPKSRALIAALEEVDDYLDNRADVDDGIPNTAMKLLTTVRTALALAKDHK